MLNTVQITFLPRALSDQKGWAFFPFSFERGNRKKEQVLIHPGAFRAEMESSRPASINRPQW